MVAFLKIKEVLLLNKPVYVRLSILGSSKTLIYDFLYGYIKNEYNNKAKLLFTDTDSMVHNIEMSHV